MQPVVEAGKVMLPQGAGWVAGFLAELLAFPAGEHDDRVDALIMARQSGFRTIVTALESGRLISDSARGGRWREPMLVWDGTDRSCRGCGSLLPATGGHAVQSLDVSVRRLCSLCFYSRRSVKTARSLNVVAPDRVG